MSDSMKTHGDVRRVVITGVGSVTSLGIGAEVLWKACLTGCSGVSLVSSFDTTGYTTKIAAEIKDWDPSPFMDKKDVKRMDRFVQFSVGAARMALEDSGLKITEENRDRVGVYIGSGIGGLGTLEAQHTILVEKGPTRVSPITIPGIICNMGAGMVSMLMDARGPISCTVTACATGNNSIGDAYHVIKRGDADAMFAGGTEACVTPLAMAGFCQARSFSTRNDDPAGASRPFDLNRDGFVLGEGAGVLMLESLESAQARGAKIYAEVAGYGLSADAFHITAPAPHGEGASRSMAMALKNAGLKPEDVDYINAHGTSTGLNDKCETAAIKTIFGESAYTVAISSTKSMTGHLVGAAGAVEAVICALAIRDGIAPPSINYETQDPECDLDYTPNVAKKLDINVAMSNSFGFGGHNATVIIKKLAN